MSSPEPVRAYPPGESHRNERRRGCCVEKWKNWKALLLLALAAVLLVLLWLGGRELGESVASSSLAAFPGPVLVIDAGHGGEDGGAVSLTGVSESQINLAVALRVDAVLGLYGVPAVLLRETDISLHSPGSTTLRQKKVSDLHNRVSAVEALENAVLLSIHQNSYPSPRYSGAQVFYAPTAGSEELAQRTQQVLCQVLDPENTRAYKKIPDTIYLMNHVTCPAVLVECGFLTNPQEEKLLLSAGYQTKLAAALAGAWLQYLQLPEDPLSSGEEASASAPLQ